MSHVKSLEGFKGESPDLEARIITAIGLAGPRNIAQISRMTGAHQETIRYKIKKRFGRLGFRFHAEVDYGKLGLSLHWATLNFAKAYDEMAPQILRGLNDVGYLTYFSKLVPQGGYNATFALPRGTTDQHKEFLARLEARGILRSSTLDEVLVERHKVMDPRFFDFRSGRWEVEWDRVAKQDPLPLRAGPKPKAQDLDNYDLLVIKELQKDSLQHLTGIARKLKVHQKTLEYHYRTHVQKWRLIPSYRIRWTQDTAKKLRHSVATTLLTFHGLSNREFAEIQAAVSKIPYLWSEHLLKSDSYIAVVHIPVADIIKVTAYLNRASPNLTSKVDIGFVNPSEAASFTIPYQMYQKGEWNFDAKQMERALRKESVVPLKK